MLSILMESTTTYMIHFKQSAGMKIALFEELGKTAKSLVSAQILKHHVMNPQSWSVISGCATEEQAKLALDSVYRELNTEHGAMLLYPSYIDHAFDGALMNLFPATTKENGGIFHNRKVG